MKELQKRKIRSLFNYLDIHNRYYHEIFKVYGVDQRFSWCAVNML